MQTATSNITEFRLTEPGQNMFQTFHQRPRSKMTPAPARV
jgi:hypothetical protein